MRNKLRWYIALALAAAGCNAPAPPPTQGTDAKAGLVVADTDYSSTNVALLGEDGSLLSPSLVSSGSGSAGLTSMLSGDVVLPGAAVRGRIVLIDRGQGKNLILWVDPAKAKVAARLRVATGFNSNPQDYAEASPHQAFVPRLGENPDPGREPYDGGSDVLVIDPSVPRITGRIDLTSAMKGADPKYLPSPVRVVLAGGQLYVLLASYAANLCDSTASRLARIDPSTSKIEDVAVLEGLHGCTSMALSPDGNTLAITCSGFEHCQDEVIAESGVALVSLGSSLALDRTFAALDLGEGAIAMGIAWTRAQTLLVSTFGQEADSSGPARPDKLIELDVATGQHRVLLKSDPFALGDVRCVPGKVCFAADAGRSVVDRFSVGAEGRLGEPAAFHAGAALGLPPRYLGWFDASGG